MHQQHFSLLQLAAIDQRVIGRAVTGEKRRAFRIIESRRQWCELRRRHHGLVAIGAMPHFDDDAVANRDAAGVIHLDHIAGSFDAGRERQWRLELIFPRRHQDVRKIDPSGPDGDARLPCRQRRRGKCFQPQALGRAEFAADDASRHQAAFALRRCTASRISGMRSLPKYMSALSTKMVGEPKPPRAITSSVLALSWSLTACSEIPAKNFSALTPTRWQISVSTLSFEISWSSPQYAANTPRANGTMSLPRKMQPRIAFTLFTGNTVGGILIA